MKFNGGYDVAREVKALDIYVKDSNVVYGNIQVDTKLHAGSTDGSEINLGSTAATSTYEDDNDDAVANQKVTREKLLTSVFTEMSPNDTTGKNKDILFKGIVETKPGGLNIIPRKHASHVPYTIASNGTDVIITCNTGSSLDKPLTIWRTSDGRKWELHETSVPASEGNYRIAATDLGFAIIPDRFRGGSHAAYYTEDLGNTWVKSAINAEINAAGMYYNTPSTYNNTVICTNADGKEPMLRSMDGGKTFTSFKLPSTVSGYVRSSAVFGTYAYAISSEGQIFRSSNSGATWSLIRTHSVLKKRNINIVALAADKLAVWSGDTYYLLWNYGSNITLKARLGGHSISGIVPNFASQKVLITTKTTVGYAYSTNMTLDGRTEIPRMPVGKNYGASYISIAPYGNGFTGYAYYGSVNIFQHIPDDLSIVVDTQAPASAVINEIYVKHDDKWKQYNPDVSDVMDKRYVPIAGGTVGALDLMGGLDMQDNKILNVPDPTDNTDAANLRYIENAVKSAASTDKDFTLTTSNVDIDTIAAGIETVKYVVSAKNGTKRYYSQVAVLMDGTNEPMIAEYSVLTIGGLDVTIDVTTLPGGTAVLKAKSNLANTTLRLRVETIDV